MKRKYIIFIISLLVLNISFAQESTRSILKQRSNSDIGKKSAAKYIFSPGSDALLMTVKVWGEVKQPGIYEVPMGMDLIELISSAGGPTARARLSKIRIIRSNDMLDEKESNPDDENRNIINVNVKEFLTTGRSDIIPLIKADDTVIVPLKPYEYVRTSLSYSQQIISLLSAYSMIYFYYLSRQE